MNDEGQVRSALRVLSLLEALNAHQTATIAQLQAATALPKPTIVRLMRTLVAAGYARQISRAQGYTAAQRVLRLADGFRHADQIIALARGPLDAFTAEHKWAVNLQTCERGAMVARYATTGRSPLSIDPTRLGKRYPVLTTANGQVFLAFCSETERQAILAMLRASKAPINAVARDADFVAETIASVQRQGYALRPATPGDRVIGFAVPICQVDGAAGTIGMRYFASAMQHEEAVARYLTPLRDLAAAVSAALDRVDPPEDAPTA